MTLPDAGPAADPVATARRLWAQGRRDAARAAIAGAQAAGTHTERLRRAARALDPVFWQPLRGRSVQLVRRGPDDLGMVRAAWADRAFMRRFHRFAAPLPPQDEALRDILRREEAATLLDARHLHWTVRTPAGDAVGMASLADIALPHGRAELLLGLRGATGRMAAEASLLALEFAFTQLGLHKVTSTVYAGNESALTATLGLGFEPEGRLRGHVRDPDTGERLDLHLSALFRDGFYGPRNEALAQRLLARPLARPAPGPAGPGAAGGRRARSGPTRKIRRCSS